MATFNRTNTRFEPQGARRSLRLVGKVPQNVTSKPAPKQRVGKPTAKKSTSQPTAKKVTHPPVAKATQALTSQFEVLPVEVLHCVSAYLSVKGLCRLRSTNQNLRAVFGNHWIWQEIIRDILTVKPLPRLRMAYRTMSTEGLINAAIQLAAQDWLFSHHSPRPLRVRHAYQVDDVSDKKPTHHRQPVPIPGGRYFVMLNRSRTRLRLYETDAGSIETYKQLVPDQPDPISHWRVIPTSPDEVLVALVTWRNKDRRSSDLVIYRKDFITETCPVVHRFFLPQEIDSMDVTHDSVAVSWYGRNAGELGCHLFVHSFLRSVSTPVVFLRMERTFISSCIKMGLLAGHRLVVTCSHAQYAISLPPFQPVSDEILGKPHEANVIQYTKYDWYKGDGTTGPPPLFPGFACQQHSPPAEIVVWSGDRIHVVSSEDQVSSDTCPDQNTVGLRSCLIGVNPGNSPLVQGTSLIVGATLGAINWDLKRSSAFVISPSFADEAGCRRLGRTASTSSILNGSFAIPTNSMPGDKTHHFAVDEESGFAFVLRKEYDESDLVTWWIFVYELR